MKAMRFHEYGEPNVLRYEDVDIPSPGAGEVRVRVAATSFNGVDANIRGGLMQGPMPVALPHTLGLDVAGVVDAVGEGVERLRVGAQVIGFLPFTVDGAAAQYVVAAADSLTSAPGSVPLADAAALPLVGLTAYQALAEHAELKPGQRIVINGAAGAVGGYATQLAKAMGAHVIATASPRRMAALEGAGADEIIDHTSVDVTDAVTAPVDVLLNLAPISPEQFAAMTHLVRDGGVIVNTTVWMPAPTDEARGVRGIDVYVRPDAGQLTDLVDRVDRDELTIEIAERAPLADLAAVHQRAGLGTLPGKVVVLAPAT